MSVFIVNGSPCSGKTTFENNVKKIMGNKTCYILSTIDPIKEIAKSIGWDGTKDLKSRKFLSDLKDLLTEWNDLPFQAMCKKVKEIEEEWADYGMNPNSIVIFIDCREPSEIRKLCTKFGAKSLLIRRADAENSEVSNHADEQVLNYDYDIIIENNGSLVEFANKAFDFVKSQNLSSLPNLTVDLFGNITE